ncbi:hypothetical protein [Aromatoleum toluclasticum]|uniref:hypothetical protein n=1 Tax=Aromatoleum toluclasticum TaxID=92003 RepID=UPI00037315DA|nr:hypothetical protein [Aromatoleum toluclasticum]
MNTLGTAAATCTAVSDAALARSILRDDAEAEDALQEGYVCARLGLPTPAVAGQGALTSPTTPRRAS